MVWLIAVIFLVLTVLLLSGKGSFLIAGYNTASKAQKAKYDEKKLSRVMGSGMGVITIFMVVLACFGNYPPDWLFYALFIAIIAVTVVMCVLCNTICKVKNPSALQEEDAQSAQAEKRRNSLIIAVSIAVTGIVLLLACILLFTGSIDIAVGENSIDIDCSYYFNYAVPLDSIKSVSYVDGFESGKRTNGLGSFKLLGGHFRNDEFGDYILYAYLNVDEHIVLHTADGIVAINAQTEQETAALYEEIKSALDA